MQKLKVGIIGAGRIGQVHAKSITYHIPQAEIVAVSDLYEDGAKKLAEELGIKNYYKDYHKILENSEIQAVLVNRYTRRYSLRGCRRGKAHFLRKAR